MTTNQSPLRLNIAVVGASQSGKTTLISSFYGHQCTNAFESEHGYQLMIRDSTQGDRLLANYYGMRDNGRFPAASSFFDEYVFDVEVQGKAADQGLELHWFDYPGAFWSTNFDGADLDVLKHLKTLLQAHVGFLLIDGKAYLEGGGNYLNSYFSQFRDYVRRVLSRLEAMGEPVSEFPRIWVLAMTKADLFGPDFTAHKLSQEIENVAATSLRDLGTVIGSKDGGLGKRVMLLSSVQSEDGRKVTSTSSYGLDLMAPLALQAMSDEMFKALQSLIPANAPFKEQLEKLLPFVLSNFPQAIDAVELAMGPKFPAWLRVLLGNLKPMVLAKVEDIERQHKEALKQRKMLESTLLGMKVTLEKSDRLYHQKPEKVAVG
ncbi:hypothetical protein D3C72_132370 [compost metagenome]